MSSTVPHRSLWSADRLSARDLACLLRTAQQLRAERLDGSAHAALAGRHIALIGAPAGADTQAFVQAAAELGVRVAQIDAESLRNAPSQRVPELARMLGRLYQGVDCRGLPAERIEQIEAHAGVPVLNGVADPAHPLRLVGDLLTMQAWSGRPLADLGLELPDLAAPESRTMIELARLSGLHVLRPQCAVAVADPSADERVAPEFRFAAGRGVAERLCTGDDKPESRRALGLLNQAHERLTLQALLVAALA
ncbi:hypothetical protein [Caldimonas sp. KR1-144]|uniref:hypothetical protein n=1 Tax=Caldimonas sp. KR1-144 TaxID=3400911 RepID=UPI003C0A1CE2